MLDAARSAARRGESLREGSKMQITRHAVAFLLAAILSACGDQTGDDGAAADLLLINGRV
jgi:hypothetical protein